MPFRDVVGHRRLVDAARRARSPAATLPPSLIFAGPAGVGKRLIALAVAQALNCTDTTKAPARRAADDGSDRRVRRVRRVRADRARRASRRPVRRAGRQRLDQDRSGSRRRRSRAAIGRSKGAAASSSSTRRTRSCRGAERAAEDARGAAVGVGVHPGHVAAGHAAADRAVALSAAALPAAVGRRCRDGADRRTARTRPRRARSRRPRTAASVARSRRAPTTCRGARRRAARAGACGGADDPRRRVESAQELLAKPARRHGDREQLADDLRAMASLLRDAELLATGADARALANADVAPALERLTTRISGERGVRAFAAVDRALVALDRNAGVKIVADWWCCSCEHHPGRRAGSSAVKLTPGRARADVSCSAIGPRRSRCRAAGDRVVVAD